MSFLAFLAVAVVLAITPRPGLACVVALHRNFWRAR